MRRRSLMAKLSDFLHKHHLLLFLLLFLPPSKPKERL